jgi:hypothetical protein
MNLDTPARIAMSGAGATRLVNRSSGTINDSASAQVVIGGTAATSFSNAGTFTKAVGSAPQQFIDAPFTSSGSVVVASGKLVATSFPVNSGVIAVSGGATFSTSDAALTNAPSGRLIGTGTFDLGAATLTNNGTIAPADSPGTLTIAGNFVQGPGGRLEIDLGGTRQGIDYDLFRVTGTANLGGTLALDVSSGATVAPGGVFDFMTYASRSGDFATTAVPAGFAFHGTPGPASYRATAADGRDSAALTEVTTFTTKEALVFGDRFFNTAAPRDPDPAQPRDELPECR